jgi:hypothetical protein
MLQRCTDSVQCRLPDSILGPPKVTSVFFFGATFLATSRQKKGGVASDFFCGEKKGGGLLFSDFVLWQIFAIFRKKKEKNILLQNALLFF